jgi:hypothetical protein
VPEKVSPARQSKQTRAFQTANIFVSIAKGEEANADRMKVFFLGFTTYFARLRAMAFNRLTRQCAPPGFRRETVAD